MHIPVQIFTLHSKMQVSIFPVQIALPVMYITALFKLVLGWLLAVLLLLLGRCRLEEQRISAAAKCINTLIPRAANVDWVYQLTALLWSVIIFDTF